MLAPLDDIRILTRILRIQNEGYDVAVPNKTIYVSDGDLKLYQRAQGDVVRVFLLPPSIEELEQRLRGRGTDSDEVIRGRMERARAEISHWDAYDYVVINDDVEACFAKVKMILEAERMRRLRQTGLIDFVRELTR